MLYVVPSIELVYTCARWQHVSSLTVLCHCTTVAILTIPSALSHFLPSLPILTSPHLSLQSHIILSWHCTLLSLTWPFLTALFAFVSFRTNLPPCFHLPFIRWYGGSLALPDGRVYVTGGDIGPGSPRALGKWISELLVPMNGRTDKIRDPCNWYTQEPFPRCHAESHDKVFCALGFLFILCLSFSEAQGEVCCK